MDASKIHAHMDEFAKIKKQGGRLSQPNSHLRNLIRAAKLLDRVDCEVLVRNPDGDGVTWERYQGCDDYTLQDGNLSILIGGTDADGDHCTGKMVCYPAGRWLKFETELTSIPNPYYADPDQPDPDDDAVPGGFESRRG